MENIAEILSQIQEKKQENATILHRIKEISSEDAKALDEKITWHSKVINYAIYGLAIWLLILSSALYTGYFKLDNRINDEAHLYIQRFDEERRFLVQQISMCSAQEKIPAQPHVPSSK